MQSEFSRPVAAAAIGDAGSRKSSGTTISPGACRRAGAGGFAAKTPTCIGPGNYRVSLGDLRAPEGGGLAVLRAIRRRDPEARILVVAADGSIIRSVSEMRKAAADISHSHRPGFAAPERDRGPEPPPIHGLISADAEVSAAVDRLVGMSLAEVERFLIEATIQACGASLPKAALVLGVSPSTLYRKRAGWSYL